MNSDLKKALLVSLAIILPACDSKTHSNGSEAEAEVVAWVGDEAITEKELLGALQHRGVNEPSEEARQEMLARLVESKRLFLSGKERGWHKDDEAVAAAMRNVGLRVQRDLESRFDSIKPPSQEEIKAYYDSHAEAFSTQESALGAILYRKEDPEQAGRFLNELLDGGTLPEDGSFGDLAAENSHDSTTRSNGGRMRWVAPSQATTSRWPQPVFDALFALTDKGQVSPVTLLPDGAFVVRLIEKRSAVPLPIERVSAEIHTKIIERRKSAVKQEFLEKLERKYPVRRVE